MKTKAVLMALAMMTTALAGCTSGTDGVPEVDEDPLNELIQDNLQDFINNTTVVVNQDFHYHNNTNETTQTIPHKTKHKIAKQIKAKQRKTTQSRVN